MQVAVVVAERVSKLPVAVVVVAVAVVAGAVEVSEVAGVAVVEPPSRVWASSLPP